MISLGVPGARAPSAPLEPGEVTVVSVDGVSLVGGRSSLPRAGTLTVTDRNLRFSASSRWTEDLLSGLPDLGGILSHGATTELAIPLRDIRRVVPGRRLVFHTLRVETKSGVSLELHLGVRRPDALLSALSR